MGVAVEEGQETKTYAAHRKERVSTTIRTMSGPLRLRNLEYLVFTERLPEVLLSRPLLKSMGFDLDRHFANVRETFHDADFSHVGFSEELQENGDAIQLEPGRLSRLLLSREEKDNVTTVICQEQSEKPEAPSPLFYGDTHGDDPIPSHEPIEVGAENRDETKIHLDLMLQEAVKSGLPSKYETELLDIVFQYQDIFRTKIGNDAPADFPPMKVILKKDSEPVRVKVRRYSPPQAMQAIFLRNKVDELRRTGLVRPNNTSRWASAPLIVPKPGPEKF